MKIFVSHTSKDKALVRSVCQRLPAWLSVWIDEDRLIAGDDLRSSLEHVIDAEADLVVLFVGDSTVDSPWVRREVDWALRREDELDSTFLVPVLLADVRDRLPEIGLSGRIDLALHGYADADVDALAAKLADHLGRWLSNAAQRSIGPVPARVRRRPNDTYADDVAESLRLIPEGWRSEVRTYLVVPFLSALADCRIGKIPLTATEYYQRIQADMGRAATGWKIYAVSTMTSRLWNESQEQNRYSERNTEAIRRGAEIRRLFITPEGMEAALQPTIEKQIESGIEARVGGQTLVGEVPSLSDFVLFVTPDGRRAYESHTAIDGLKSVRSGRLFLAEHDLESFHRTFTDAWGMALPVLSGHRSRQRSGAPTPGESMEVHKLPAPVVTCEEAAAARGVPLSHELKTLILQTNTGLVAAHLPGDGRLSLRKVKDRLEASEAHLADPEDLLELGLSAGTVSAVLDPVWSMRHIVSRRLLTYDEVTTNNGTKTAYFAFPPSVLLQAADVTPGDFER